MIPAALYGEAPEGVERFVPADAHVLAWGPFVVEQGERAAVGVGLVALDSPAGPILQWRDGTRVRELFPRLPWVTSLHVAAESLHVTIRTDPTRPVVVRPFTTADADLLTPAPRRSGDMVSYVREALWNST